VPDFSRRIVQKTDRTAAKTVKRLKMPSKRTLDAGRWHLNPGAECTVTPPFRSRRKSVGTATIDANACRVKNSGQRWQKPSPTRHASNLLPNMPETRCRLCSYCLKIATLYRDLALDKPLHKPTD
jgi:hypothetical protein